MSYRSAIHDTLVTAANTGAFTEVTYTTTRPSLMVDGLAMIPRSVEANEIRGRFGIDENYGREYRQEREGWAWLLKVRFNAEANLEQFETTLMQSPLIISRDLLDGRDRQVNLLLEESSYEHPPRGGASNGTEVTYRFVAELCQQ